MYVIFPPGEKPFDTIEDLVQDGLIILYMEANHVEEYLQSARETRLTRQASITGANDVPSLSSDITSLQKKHSHSVEGEDPVFREGDELPEVMEELNVVEEEEGEAQAGRHRRPLYHPCTIPLRRDCTNLFNPIEAGQEDSLEAELEVSNHFQQVHVSSCFDVRSGLFYASFCLCL